MKTSAISARYARIVVRCTCDGGAETNRNGRRVEFNLTFLLGPMPLGLIDVA